MYHPPKPPPISYAEGPRLLRAAQRLSPEQQAQFIATANKHMTRHHIESLQRRGQCLHVAVDGQVSIYDFGSSNIAQNCLTALTDCLRSRHAPVQVLMPV